MNIQIFRSSVAIAGMLVIVGSAAFSQTSNTYTSIDIVSAKAIAMAADRQFGNPLQNIERIKLSSATVDQGATVHVEIASPDGVRAFDVAPATNTVSASPPRTKTASTVAISGKFLLALLLSDREWSASKSPLRANPDVRVQLNVPYDALPNRVFVWYFPKTYPKRSIPEPGCDPTVGFNVDVGSGTLSTLKPPC